MFWLSFADPNLPEGTQFRGCIIVREDDFMLAVMKTHRLKINPGGEVQGYPIPEELIPLIEDRWVECLLPRSECEAFDLAMQEKMRAAGLCYEGED